MLKEYIQLDAIIAEMQMAGMIKIPSTEKYSQIWEKKISTMKKWYFKGKRERASADHKTKLYLLEVGVLLDESHPDFKCYSKVYDRKHGYYDECQYLKKDKQEAIAEAKKYVEDGVLNTYAVITEQVGFPDGMTEQDMKSFDANETCYDAETVVYSVMKDVYGNIVENFIG